MSESAAERLTAWLWEDERLTAGLEDVQAGVLLQWAADVLIQAAALQPHQLSQLTANLRSVFLAARRADALPEQPAAWADAELERLRTAEALTADPEHGAAECDPAMPEVSGAEELQAAEPDGSPVGPADDAHGHPLVEAGSAGATDAAAALPLSAELFPDPEPEEGRC